jgi:hypothetical protein
MFYVSQSHKLDDFYHSSIVKVLYSPGSDKQKPTRPFFLFVPAETQKPLGFSNPLVMRSAISFSLS